MVILDNFCEVIEFVVFVIDLILRLIVFGLLVILEIKWLSLLNGQLVVIYDFVVLVDQYCFGGVVVISVLIEEC